jgi:hypothetical protein
MKTEIDESKITHELIKRWGKLDTDTVHGILWMIDKRINLSDHAYTTMDNKAWLKHFREQLSDYLDFQDEAEQNHNKHMRTALSNMLDAYENPEY